MNLKIGDIISFKVSYFKNYFKFYGEIIDFKGLNIVVKYENVIDDKRYVLQTEIADWQLVN